MRCMCTLTSLKRNIPSWLTTFSIQRDVMDSGCNRLETATDAPACRWHSGVVRVTLLHRGEPEKGSERCGLADAHPDGETNMLGCRRRRWRAWQPWHARSVCRVLIDDPSALAPWSDWKSMGKPRRTPWRDGLGGDSVVRPGGELVELPSMASVSWVSRWMRQINQAKGF
jgi:hypothetical protein